MKENYRKLMTNNGTENMVRVIPLTDAQAKGFTRFCKKNCTMSGNDNKRHFFVYSGIYGYHIDFISTKSSGHFAKIKAHFCPRGL